MSATQWGLWSLGVATVLAVLGFLLRYRDWVGPVAGFVSDVHPDSDASASARAAGKGALLLAGLFGLYGVLVLAATVPSWLDTAFYVAGAFVVYRALHWVVRAGGPDGRPRRRDRR